MSEVVQAHRVTFRAEGGILIIEFRHNDGSVVAEAHMPDVRRFRNRFLYAAEQAERDSDLDGLVDETTALPN